MTDNMINTYNESSTLMKGMKGDEDGNLGEAVSVCLGLGRSSGLVLQEDF